MYIISAISVWLIVIRMMMRGVQYEYGMDSCFNDSKKFVFARLCLG